MKLRAIVIAAIKVPALAQLEPESAHVRLYLPQIADGGPPDNQWQTVLTFMNPNTWTTADVVVSFFGNDGKNLPLDFGAGPSTELSFSIPPHGVRMYWTNRGKPP